MEYLVVGLKDQRSNRFYVIPHFDNIISHFTDETVNIIRNLREHVHVHEVVRWEHYARETSLSEFTHICVEGTWKRVAQVSDMRALRSWILRTRFCGGSQVLRVINLNDSSETKRPHT